MNLIKSTILVLLCIAFSFPAFSQKDNTGTYIDQEVIPYGFLQFNMGLVHSQFAEYQLEPNLTKRTVTGTGIGLNGNFPLIYLLAHNKERRFRVADDLGLGTYMITNKVKREDAVTGMDLGNSETNSKINGSIIFFVGLQAVLRINKTFDIGVKYDPVFLHYDFMNPGAFGQTFGFSARVQRLYIDGRITKTKNKDYTVNSGLRTLNMRYAIYPFDSGKNPKYLFLTISSLKFRYINQGDKNSNWTLVEVGYGMGI